MICTFFGHGDTHVDIRPILKATLIKLIDNEGANKFYVGNHGNFDRMAISILSELSQIRSFNYFVVLAYPPTDKDFPYIDHTVLPDNIENVPPKFAISFRNKFMVEKVDCVITYVKHSWGGAAKYKQMAEKKNKRIIELSEK